MTFNDFLDVLVLSKCDLMLLNTNPIFGYNRTMKSSTKQIGFATVEPPKKLPDGELKDFLDKSIDGTVIICFGSTLKTRDLGDEITEIFSKVFADFSHLNFIWKFDDEVHDFPSNVMTTKWLPLADTLAHQNVKILITHGGLNSAYEAIDREIPMIIFPFSVDQPANAKMMVFRGIAVELDINLVTAEELKAAILRALSEEFKANVRKIRKLINEQATKPLDVAVESIEEVLGNKSRKKRAKNSEFPVGLVLETFLILIFVKFIYKRLMKFLNKILE